VLELTVSEAAALLPRATARWSRGCSRCVDVGLDYLRLGQPVPTLSGGEAQRLKLAGFLAEAASHRPHSAWRKKARCSSSTSPPRACTSTTSPSCMRALRKLLDAGHSLLVIEHNLDVIRAGRLDHRPRPRGRRSRRRTSWLRARRTTCAPAPQLAHRRGAARVRRWADEPGEPPRPGRRAAAGALAARRERARCGRPARSAHPASSTPASTTCKP
jgi:hypothetical protein